MERIGKFEALTRAGFAARGVVYALVGVLTLTTGRAEGSAGAIRTLQESTWSGVLLVAIGFGLACYGLWRLTETALDLEGHGNGGKGLAIRLGHAISGLVHLALAVLAFSLPFSESGGERDNAQNLAAWLLGLPSGGLLVLLLAVAFLLTALAQGRQAYQLKYLHQLDPEAARRSWVKWIGRLGYLARAVIFLLVGFFFLQAGAAGSAEQAGGMAEALQALPDWGLNLVAAGLFLFGLFSLIQAVYRRITSDDVRRRLAA